MKQTFDLNKMGLAPMSISEMQEVDGGNPFWVAFGIGIAVTAAYDFLVGVVEGFVKAPSVNLT